jgi:phage N-6-adenine-methyltransferase
MNTEVMFSSKSDEWPTPQDFFDRLDAEFRFQLDAAADGQNCKVVRYFDQSTNGLEREWHPFTTWCNPPYSDIAQWVKKSYEESSRGATVVMLIPARTDTRYWHDYVMKAHEIRFVKGRLKFGDSKNSAPFPSAVVVFRPGHDGLPLVTAMEAR